MGLRHISCLVLLAGAALVTPSPVYPIVPLNGMDPIDSCLFVCNICFDKQPKTMMDCVRDVCLSTKKSRGETYNWIVLACRNYANLDNYTFGVDNKL